MFLYIFILHIAALFNQKARLLIRGEKQALRELREKVDPTKKYIWFHAASVGEFEQGRPIIERLKRERPDAAILLTFFSPSGYEMRKDYPLADIVCYLPFATRKRVRQFLNIVPLEKAIFIKYEFWPAYLHRLKHRGIPTYIFATIFNEKQLFFKSYGQWYRRLLYCFTHIYVQDTASKELLHKYGIDNVSIAGDTRFDRVKAISSNAKPIEMVEQFLGNSRGKVIVAGSTWKDDEELLARYLKENEDARLILVPHEIDQHHQHKIFQIFQGRFVRFTEATQRNIDTCNMLMLNTMGMLSSIYRYATVAYIGGGFGAGIHNTLEAAVYGVPVIWGPNYQRFREAHGLIAAGGGFSVSNYAELKQTMDYCLEHHEDLGKKSMEYVRSELGATDVIYKGIFES